MRKLFVTQLALTSALTVILLTACDGQTMQAVDATPSAVTLSQPDPAPTQDPVVDPSPTPTPVSKHKSILSAWVRSDGYYKVDFSVLTNTDTTGGIIASADSINRIAVWFDFGNVKCSAKLQIVGTEDNGTLTITLVNGGTPNINSGYCNPLLGTYQYTAMPGDTYRLDKGGVLTFLQ